MKRLEFLKSYVEFVAEGSRLEYLGGNFYIVSEGAAQVLCALGIALDPDAPTPQPEIEVPLAPEPLADSTGLLI